MAAIYWWAISDPACGCWRRAPTSKLAWLHLSSLEAAVWLTDLGFTGLIGGPEPAEWALDDPPPPPLDETESQSAQPGVGTVCTD
jgi:hypothetical protein